MALVRADGNPYHSRILWWRGEDSAGRRVKTLASGFYDVGRHAIAWDRRDQRGNRVQPGVYAYRLIAGEFQARKSMIILP